MLCHFVSREKSRSLQITRQSKIQINDIIIIRPNIGIAYIPRNEWINKQNITMYGQTTSHSEASTLLHMMWFDVCLGSSGSVSVCVSARHYNLNNNFDYFCPECGAVDENKLYAVKFVCKLLNSSINNKYVCVLLMGLRFHSLVWTYNDNNASRIPPLPRIITRWMN